MIEALVAILLLWMSVLAVWLWNEHVRTNIIIKALHDIENALKALAHEIHRD